MALETLESEFVSSLIDGICVTKIITANRIYQTYVIVTNSRTVIIIKKPQPSGRVDHNNHFPIHISNIEPSCTNFPQLGSESPSRTNGLVELYSTLLFTVPLS